MGSTPRLTHLKQLEAESIHIIREVAAEFEKPVMLYSIGKDSSVLVRLAQKAFHPAPLPFPLLHIDTTWKFRDMIAFRDRFVQRERARADRAHQPRRRCAENINPFDHGSEKYTTRHEDAGAAAGARRSTASTRPSAARAATRRSRAPRSASTRSAIASSSGTRRTSAPSCGTSTTPRSSKGESIRVFPLSNWTELDVWQYIYLENIPIVPLYFAARAPGGRARRHARSWSTTSACACAPGEMPRRSAWSASARSAATRSRAPSRSSATTLPRDHPRDAARRASPSARAGSSTTTRTRRWRRKKREGYF